MSLMLVGSAIAEPPGAGPAIAQDEIPTLLLYGDSLLAGYGLDSEYGFARQLSIALAEKDVIVDIRNASVSGDTSTSGLARLEWSLFELPDAVLVGLGANDMLRGLPVENLRTNLTSILSRFASEDIPVLLLGMMANRGLGADYVEEFDAVYPDLAEQFDDVALYPFFLEGVAQEAAFNQSDGLHPNAAGVAEIVERLVPHVIDLLEQAG